MNEFSLIERFFQKQAFNRSDVVKGIGDDAACLRLPNHHDLVVSTDTLVAGVHFLTDWDAYDIAWRAVMVNISDIAAMAAVPSWATLALTLPDVNVPWLARFSEGLHAALNKYHVALVGGDTTRGPLTITLTVHGSVLQNKALKREGAKVGDSVWLSGVIGAAAQAVALLKSPPSDLQEWSALVDKLQRPVPRVDLVPILQTYASAAIDVSDGLSADLNHLCVASAVGACLQLSAIPVHPLVKKYQPNRALSFALGGGDDYELCFTVPSAVREAFEKTLYEAQVRCYAIGVIEKEPGLRGVDDNGSVISLAISGYSHF